MTSPQLGELIQWILLIYLCWAMWQLLGASKANIRSIDAIHDILVMRGDDEQASAQVIQQYLDRARGK